jgi:hypothetical protein
MVFQHFGLVEESRGDRTWVYDREAITTSYTTLLDSTSA